jgi:hypothetical protein
MSSKFALRNELATDLKMINTEDGNARPELFECLRKIPFTYCALISFLRLQLAVLSGLGVGVRGASPGSAIVVCARLLLADSKARPTVCFYGYCGIISRSLPLETGTRALPDEYVRDVIQCFALCGACII